MSFNLSFIFLQIQVASLVYIINNCRNTNTKYRTESTLKLRLECLLLIYWNNSLKQFTAFFALRNMQMVQRMNLATRSLSFLNFFMICLIKSGQMALNFLSLM
ncbi:hypothetical protein FGO68_gene4776 [Halteria grandinella]|uniref:Uncharacterized protein n=1 Tax=Halteria grandinella TaxID=5974 RepID=A0A8J8T3M8_HALGN|nr:hypothetical protein FGO68_gene4776 [Halteria grandinella]